ncbi:glycosyltransferase, family 1 [Campylobacter iguaniorum]|uniref:glycosyltransferase n=1 Tax=Campylobacter iguaniorum TaxID=1244531 RepID=UPI00073A0C29|nr:glycosyltransferase [Campylobacter iguaniorum]ALV25143.1 glycosyltransferase, family 1 [Campylobacter iguaniorum]
MRILFVISTLRAGGAERVASALANALSNAHEISLLRFDDAKPFYEINQNVKLMSLEYGVSDFGLIGNLKKRFSKILALRNVINGGKFDAVISFMDSTNLLVLAASTWLKTPIFISEHSYCKFLSLKWRILKRIFYPLATGLSVLTKEDLEYYKFVKNTKIIYNPMNFVPSNLSQPKENLIIFVGRLIKPKGCDIFLSSLKLLQNELKGWKIAILGDGDERVNLQKTAQNINLDIEFCGMVQNIDEFYKKAKILALSSRFEGLGNAFIEAIFYDVLRVATPTSGAKELIKDGFDGFISSDFEPESFAKKLKEALNLDANLTQNARVRQSEFDIKTIQNQWVDFIQKAKK